MASGYADSVNGTALTEGYLDDNLMKQAVLKYASAATRTADAALTAALREGMVSYQDDTNILAVYSGSAWSTLGPVHGALTSWTPTVTQSGSVTVTNTYSRYIRVGRLVTGWFNVIVTGSGTGGNAVVIGGLPFSGAATGFKVGIGEIFDSSSTLKYGGSIHVVGATTMDYRQIAGGAALDNRLGIVGFTVALAVNDTLEGCFSYEVGADA